MHYLESELASLFESEDDTWRFVQSASLDGVWYWDLEDTNNLWISPEYWDCLGIDPATREHSPAEFIDVVFDEDLPNIMDNLEKHYADASVVYEQIVRFRHADGSTVWVRCRGKATRDKNGKAIRMLGAHNNITALKEAEFNTQRLMKNRERFFARMSHEIRTPLHGILGIAQVLKNENLSPSVIKKLSTIMDCGEQLKHLLDDLLTISKIDEDKFTISQGNVCLSDIFDYIDSLFRTPAEAKSLTFTLPDTSKDKLIVQSDQIRLTQIISNLVNNAIKFTQTGEVSIDIADEATHFNISITDTGEGIEDTNAVLGAYHQEVHSNILLSEGTGLGLEIVEKLCDALGHKLHIESKRGEGTTVTVSLIKSFPNNTLKDEERSYSVDVTRKVLPKTVLIVDDNEINCEIARNMLEAEIDTIDIAKNGEEAVNMVISNNGYDLILMDLNMPVKNGYQASEDIHALDLTGAANRIIAISADAFEEISQQCAKCGIGQHIAKPFTRELLLAAILDPLEQSTLKA